MRLSRKESSFDERVMSIEEEIIFLREIGNVIKKLHKLSEVDRYTAEIQMGTVYKTLQRICRGAQNTSLTTYQRIFICYLQEIGVDFYLLRLLQQIPPCIEQRKNLIVSLMSDDELVYIPKERVILSWKGLRDK